MSSTLLLCALGVIVSGCQPEESPIVLSDTGKVTASIQRSGNAETGYRVLTEIASVTCGIPVAALQTTFNKNTPTIPGRKGDNAALPYYFTLHRNDDDVPLATTNCLACHASQLFGELVIGLGNELLDFTVDQTVSAERVGALVTGDKEAAAWSLWADRTSIIGPYMRTDTVGVNPANNLTLALIAHRDPQTLAWSDKPLIDPPPTKPLPVSVPPWWRMKKKNSMFYTSEGRGDHARLMMSAALLCTDSVEEAQEIDVKAPHLRAYLASIEPPAYPFAIDPVTAAEGQTLFEGTCSRCHGTYGADAHYPNLVIALEEIGSDPGLAIRSTEQSGRFISWYNQSFFGEMAHAAPAKGYVAPPLDGIWATAPFLHNGSVPNIEAMLNSKVRPRYWKPSTDRAEYDERRLGWVTTEVHYGKSESQKGEARYIYDTTITGYANSGHLFGDHLTTKQRRAVIEYLKTL